MRASLLATAHMGSLFTLVLGILVMCSDFNWFVGAFAGL